MIRVGFLINASPDWIGGVNYMKNLLYAINTLKDDQIETIVFVPTDVARNFADEFRSLTKVVEVSFMTRKSLNWIIWRGFRKLFESDFMVEIFLQKYKIDIFSHSNLIGLKKSKTVNWIPDFQHMKLPDMFQADDIRIRTSEFFKMSRKSDAVILSSFDALRDYRFFTKDTSEKARVLQFVSQPGKYRENSQEELNAVRTKYNLGNDFFLIPNHFWKHKNHMVVFSAMAILRKKGLAPTMVCTGRLDDYRHPEYIEKTKKYIIENQIDVRLLGLIGYDELIILLKNAIAVINPSFFEGWSTTVEECKSLGKNMILSDIGVHREQNPPDSYFFTPENSEDLASILEFHLQNKGTLMKIHNREEYTRYQLSRTKEFAENYESIIKEILAFQKR